MKKNKLYTFEEDLDIRLKDPTFKKAWNDSEPEYMLAKKLIEKRMQHHMSQRELAKRVKTTQAIISRIETMQANPSLMLLKRIAEVFDTKVYLQFR